MLGMYKFIYIRVVIIHRVEFLQLRVRRSLAVYINRRRTGVRTLGNSHIQQRYWFGGLKFESWTTAVVVSGVLGSSVVRDSKANKKTHVSLTFSTRRFLWRNHLHTLWESLMVASMTNFLKLIVFQIQKWCFLSCKTNHGSVFTHRWAYLQVITQ